MYKSDRHRAEDAIIPMLLKSLMITHIEQCPEKKESYRHAMELISEDLDKEINGHQLYRRLTRISSRVSDFWVKNKTEVSKAYMEISHLAAELVEQGVVELRENTMGVLKEINDIIVDAYKSEDSERITKQDKSAGKQWRNILKILQGERLFED